MKEHSDLPQVKTGKHFCVCVCVCVCVYGASLIAQLGKNLPVMRKSYVQFLCKEDALEKEMATHSSILA